MPIHNPSQTISEPEDSPVGAVHEPPLHQLPRATPWAERPQHPRILGGLLVLLTLTLWTVAWSQEVQIPGVFELEGSIRGVHDPMIAEHDGRYYLYSTGRGIPIRCSDDLITWRGCGLVFFGLPSWGREVVPGVTDFWAPDVSFFNGTYHLYYSLSVFGYNTSAIGLATNTTLDMDSPDYEWVDRGVVIRSQPENDWNAIDPNIILDDEGTPWLTFGSYWSGIKMIRIDPETGMQAEEDDTLYALASRHEPPRAIEAPFIIRREGYYYLFVSFDMCCEGVDSTYNIRVGRATEVTGPYYDRDDTPMLEGGGTLLIESGERWRGPGHNAIFHHDGDELLVYHAYDTEFGGVPTLHIERLIWDDEGWPSVPSVVHSSQP